MPLERFIPLSPDPNITTSSDMGMAQFGHLNTIVDYLNTYVAADSLQLEGVGPLSATARYITDSAGNLSSLAISTGNIGIGTIISTYKFMVSDNSGNDGPVFFEKNSLGGQSDCYVYNKNASTNLTTGQLIGTLTFGGYFNSTFSPGSQDVAAIFGQYTGTGTNRKGQLQFRTHDSSGMQSAMTINDTQLVGVGETSPTARLHVKGRGATSATTSLLVQNSNALTNLQITDDGQVSVINEGKFSVVRYGNTLLSTGQATSSLSTYNSSVTVTNTYVAFNTLGNFGWSFLQDLFQGYHPMIIQDATFKARETSALVELNSKTRGFLKPKMTTAQKNAIATPTAGLEVYDTDLNRPCFYSGSAWVTL
jgi:hypothetical protein